MEPEQPGPSNMPEGISLNSQNNSFVILLNYLHQQFNSETLLKTEDNTTEATQK